MNPNSHENFKLFELVVAASLGAAIAVFWTVFPSIVILFFALGIAALYFFLMPGRKPWPQFIFLSFFLICSYLPSLPRDISPIISFLNPTSIPNRPAPTFAPVVFEPTNTPRPILPTYTPTVIRTATPPPPPTNTPAPRVGNFSGTWYHNYGSMTLSQNGADVFGRHYNGLANVQEEIRGRVFGNTLNGTWSMSNGESGAFQLNLDANGDTFDGYYANRNLREKWCGARSGKPFRDGCGFAGRWFISLPGFDAREMNLTQINDSVYGPYYDGKSISGRVTFDTTTPAVALVGTWYVSVNGDTGRLSFYLLDLEGGRLQGSWEDQGGNKFPWCGWRSGYSAPSPCLR